MCVPHCSDLAASQTRHILHSLGGMQSLVEIVKIRGLPRVSAAAARVLEVYLHKRDNVID